VQKTAEPGGEEAASLGVSAEQGMLDVVEAHAGRFLANGASDPGKITHSPVLLAGCGRFSSL
jgi:hypothetical protein